MPRQITASLLAVVLLTTVVLSSVARAKDVPRERTPQPAAGTLPFGPTEQLVYEGEFSKLLLRGIKIAELRFKVGRRAEVASAQSEGAAQTLNQSPIIFTTDVESKGWFQKLFGINFRFHAESTVEPDSFSVVRTTKKDEQGKRVRTSEAVFDRSANKVEWTELDPNDPNRPPRVVTAELDGTTHDVISVIYYLRTQQLSPGQTIELVVSDSGQVYKIPVKVFAEKKAIKTALGKVSVLRLDVYAFGQGRPIEGEGKMSLWLTNDARRIPVRAKLSNDMGTLSISLKEAF